MEVTIRQRAQVALHHHSVADEEFRRAMRAGQFAEACLWKDTRAACMDEADECAMALALGAEPEQSEILMGNADIHAP